MGLIVPDLLPHMVPMSEWIEIASSDGLVISITVGIQL